MYCIRPITTIILSAPNKYKRAAKENDLKAFLKNSSTNSFLNGYNFTWKKKDTGSVTAAAPERDYVC